jgi:hypothetical protein
MFIRRTTIKSRETGEPYYTYRLVESVRTGTAVRQHTVLNLGRRFEVPRAQWGPLARRIEALVQGQLDLIADGLEPAWEALAEQYAARIVSRRGVAAPAGERDAQSDYQRVDLDRVEVIRPRSVGVEHVALEALRHLGLDVELAQLGFNLHPLSAAIGVIVGRRVRPGSELATHQWLQQRSGLGELIDDDFASLDLNRLYRVSDRLLAHRATLEAFLYQQECDLFSLTETITLYDLTNTFFEGTASANPKAKRGHSKEKRSDCPLVTLALVLVGSGQSPSAARSSPTTSANPRHWRKCSSASRRPPGPWPRRWSWMPALPPRRTLCGFKRRATATWSSAANGTRSSTPSRPP